MRAQNPPAELSTPFSWSILALMSGKLPSGTAGTLPGKDELRQEEYSWQEEQHVLKPQGEVDLGCWGMGTSLRISHLTPTFSLCHPLPLSPDIWQCGLLASTCLDFLSV